MWKYIFLLAIVLMVGGADITKVENKESKENKEITTLQKNLNDSSRETTKQDKETTPQVLNGNKIDETSDEGSELNPINPINHVHKESKEVFNYYFIILVVSSLSVMIVISIRANRLRKTRAEIKYGKNSDKSEVEPLGKSQWLEESSDENEDEIFDINFLKNKRTQNV